MENIHFSAETVIGAIAQGFIGVMLPIVLIVACKLKTKAKLVPFWVGCLVFPVFAFIIEGSAALGITLIDKYTLGILTKPLPLYLFSAAMAGIFEETGRLIGMKTLMRKYKDKCDGITYGIGHGGIESIIIVGGASFLTLFIAFLTNTGMLDTVTAQYSPALKEMFITNLKAMTGGRFADYILAGFERVSAIILHVSLSVIVFTGVRIKGRLWHYPLAVFLHFAADCTVILVHVFGMPLWLFEIIFFAASVAVAVPTVIYYLRLPQILGEETAAPIQSDIQAQ